MTVPDVPNETETPRLPLRLSPSRMSDFLKCPKAFHFKSILKLETLPSVATTRGTITHEVLEKLFDADPDGRTPELAKTLIGPAWQELAKEPAYRALVAPDGFSLDDHDPEAGEVPIDAGKEKDLLDQVEGAVDRYFTMENPKRFTPTGRELRLTGKFDDVEVLGIIDRYDEIKTKDGETRVYISDYKTGKMPKEQYQDSAFFAMKVYALLVHEGFGKMPYSLRLLYLSPESEGDVLELKIGPQTVRGIRQKVLAIAKAIEQARDKDLWPTKTGPLCNWCDFQPICPAFNPGLDGLTLVEKAAD